MERKRERELVCRKPLCDKLIDDLICKNIFLSIPVDCISSENMFVETKETNKKQGVNMRMTLTAQSLLHAFDVFKCR